MSTFNTLAFNYAQCETEVKELVKLLNSKAELDEKNDILPFFKRRMHLSAYIAKYVPDIQRYDKVKHEFRISGEFSADLVVGDSSSRAYCFIEFEDAKKNSIFVKKKRNNSEWSRRFEHGFSQIVDWFWRLDDLKKTDFFDGIFGSSIAKANAILVIGRDSFLSESEQRRLKWRLDKVLVNSNKVHCVTFDQLANDIADDLTLLRTMTAK